MLCDSEDCTAADRRSRQHVCCVPLTSYAGCGMPNDITISYVLTCLRDMAVNKTYDRYCSIAFFDLIPNCVSVCLCVYLESQPVAAKLLEYNRANRTVAVLCNHQRAVPKNFSKQMENLQAKVCIY